MERLSRLEFLIIGVIFGMLVIPIYFAEAAEWKMYVGDMPKHWESKFGNLLYHATQYWQNQFPETIFYKVSNLENADFVIQWASEYQSDEKTNTKRLGYYTTNFKNEYGKPYVAITLGFMTGDGINKKFQLVDEEYALLITVHEIGHAIGLGHSDNPNNIMYPSIYNYPGWLELKGVSDLQQSNQTQNEFTESNLSDLVEIKPIPARIKNNAGWWANNQIDDKTFVEGIQFLIKAGIIVHIPETTKSSTDTSDSIPIWIKNNAGWWVDGMITEGEFLNGIEYFVKNRVIQIN